MTTTKTPRRRRMAREAQIETPVLTKSPSKLDQVEALLLAEHGTTIAAIMTVTGWQQHSVRGALAGALKQRGLILTSEKVDGVRRYRARRPA